MAKITEHWNCPRPPKNSISSPVRTVYVRELVERRMKWVPIGVICMGCGVFRCIPYTHFPHGPADAMMKPNPLDPGESEDRVSIPYQPPLPPETIDEHEDVAAMFTDLAKHPPMIAELDVAGVGEELPARSMVNIASSTTSLEMIDLAGTAEDLASKTRRRRGRPRLNVTPAMAGRLLGIDGDEVQRLIYEGVIPATRDKFRHYWISPTWYRLKCESLGKESELDL